MPWLCSRSLCDACLQVEASPLTGSFLAAWCGGDVSLLNLSSGSLLRRIAAGSDEAEEQFSSFALSPDEKTLATVARKSRLIQLWDVETGAETASWKASHALPVLDLAFAPSGGELASCAADKAVVVYSIRRAGVVTHRFAPSPAAPQKGGHKSRVVRLAWHPSVARAQLISCAEDGEMRLWSLKDRDAPGVLLSNHMAQVTSVAFSRDGNTMVSGGRDKVVNVWSMATDAPGKHLRTLPVYESVEGIAILAARPSCVKADSAPVGKDTDLYFTTAGSKGSLRTWSLNTLQCVHTKDLPTAAITASTQAAAGADDSTLSHAQRNAAKYIANQVAHLLKIPARKADDAAGVAAQEERVIAVTQEQNFYIYSTSTFARVQLLLGFNDEIIDLKAHPDNTHALMAANSSQIRVVHLDTFQADLLSGHTDTVLALDISPCGQYVVSSSKDTTVRFWRLDMTRGEADGGVSELIGVGEGHTESVGCVTFSKNKHTGKLFAVSGARERIMKLWDCSVLKTHVRGSPPLQLTAVMSRLAHEKDINTLQVAPNDKLVASGSEDKLIRVWDTTELAPRAVLKGHRRGVWCIQFSPVDKVLASASGDKTIKLWSMDDYSCLKTLESHTASVKQVHFINAGMQLLSCGDDSVVKLWTIKTAECVATFSEAHEGKIWAMAVTPDGRRMLSGGSDSVLSVWTDVSAADVEEEESKKETFLLQEQQLNNLIRQKRFSQAVSLCLTLEQPRKCFTIVQELLHQEVTQHTPSELPSIVVDLSDDLLSRLLLYIRDWNTHAKSSHVAQSLLACIFRVLSPARLISNRTLLQQSNNLTLYSERHFARIDKLLTKSFIMDHMLNAMHAYEPDQSVTARGASATAGSAGTVSSDDVLQQLLASAAADTEPAAPIGASRVAAAAAVSMGASADDDEDGEGFSDDDGAAWATNWQQDGADDEDKKEEVPSAAKTAAEPEVVPAATGKNKRKAPAAVAAPAAADKPAKSKSKKQKA